MLLFVYFAAAIFFKGIEGLDQRCYYRQPSVVCSNRQFGPYTVYDSVRRQCIRQSTGCIEEYARDNSFASPEECQRICIESTYPRIVDTVPQIMRQPPVEQNQQVVSAINKCAFLPPDLSCTQQIGSFLVYDPNRRQCVVQSTACSLSQVVPYAFANRDDCERTCGQAWTEMTRPDPIIVRQQFFTSNSGVIVPGSASVNKCSYAVPEATCMMAFREPFMIFDSRSGRCQFQFGGCSASDVQPYAFSTRQDCEQTCVRSGGSAVGQLPREPRPPVVIVTQPPQSNFPDFADPYYRPPQMPPSVQQPPNPRPPSNSNAKCNYRPPEITCMMYIGDHIVYNANLGQCVTISSGCSGDELQQYAFRNEQECMATCGGGRTVSQNSVFNQGASNRPQQPFFQYVQGQGNPLNGQNSVFQPIRQYPIVNSNRPVSGANAGFNFNPGFSGVVQPRQPANIVTQQPPSWDRDFN